jgi:hypothetical protein
MDVASILKVKHCFAYPQGDGKPDAVVFVMPGVDPDFVLKNDIPSCAQPRRISLLTAIRMTAAHGITKGNT